MRHRFSLYVAELCFCSVLIAVLCTPSAEAQQAKPSKASQKLLAMKPMDILNACLAKAETLEQFTQHFTKQERLGGKLQETETMFLKYRAKPLSIYMKWIKDPHKGREIIYVEGRHKGKAVLHEYVALLNVLVKMDPNSAETKKRSRRPITAAGIRNATRSLVDVSERARKRGQMTLTTLGIDEVDGKQTVVLCRQLEKHKDCFVYMTIIHIDPELMLPVKVIGYDWDHTLSWIYKSGNFDTTVKLTDEDFNPKNREYDYPSLIGLELPKLWPFGKKDK